VITLSIYTGIATPTEAAAVAALLTVILAFGVGGLNMAGFKDALFATMRTMGYLGLLLSAGVLFGFVMTYYRVPQQFTDCSSCPTSSAPTWCWRSSSCSTSCWACSSSRCR
jgi:C4-dicarboxylate transporter, DctM subunit